MPSDVNTLYIGGGTPSVLPLSVYRSLMDALESVGVKAPFEEFTFEVNPDDIVLKGEEYVESLMALGVNRFSMGVQSFDDGILKWMNRRHDSAAARKAYEILENAGASNISIDLIFGMPQLTDEVWRDTLDKALDISARGILPKHISSYQLSVEPGSALASLVARGEWSEASEELCARQYSILCDTLNKAGYHHYEISNFARPGFEAVHNSAYWDHVPYVGLGPGAHGMQMLHSEKGMAEVVRKWNLADIDSYLKAAGNADLSPVQEHEVLTSDQIVMERIMLALRTSKGMSEDFLKRHCDPEVLAGAMFSGDLLPTGDGCLRIPENRFFVSDAIIAELI